jgi:hypothetical protein
MHRLHRAARIGAGVCLALLAAPLAAAQTSPIQGTNQASVYIPTSLQPDDPFSLPRTRDGRPDFTDAVWTGNFFGMLESVPFMLPAELVLPEDKAKQAFDKMMAMFTSNPAIKAAIEADPEASALVSATDGLPVVRGQRRTRLLVLPIDGKLPYTPEARKEASGAMARMAALKSDNPEERTSGERCIALGAQPPMAVMSALHPRQFIQTPGHVIIRSEYGDEARIIPFAAAHRLAALQPSMGDSIARWEGDTLVIETTGFPETDRLRGAFPIGLILNPDSKVIERYTRLGKDELLYQFTIEDPKIYTAPWLAEYSLFRANYRMYPSGCHEGNYSMSNILSGQRVVDARGNAARD